MIRSSSVFEIGLPNKPTQQSSLRPAADRPAGPYADEVVVWQLGEFKESPAANASDFSEAGHTSRAEAV